MCCGGRGERKRKTEGEREKKMTESLSMPDAVYCKVGYYGKRLGGKKSSRKQPRQKEIYFINR